MIVFLDPCMLWQKVRFHFFYGQDSTEGYFDYVQVLATMNNASMKVGVHISLQIQVSEFYG